MGPTLLVPINIQALCIGSNDATNDTFTGPNAYFEGLPWYNNPNGNNSAPNVSEQFTYEPFSSALTQMEQGIHLHWALPDALTQGTKDSKADVHAFPKVPNRWLITRIITDYTNEQSPSTTQKSWVLESDYLSTTFNNTPDTNNVTIPLNNNNGSTQPYNYVGKIFDASNWSENASALHWDGLCAIGYGNLHFASFYPNCRNVFGIYDDLSDLINYDPDNSTITYHVIGWFSDVNNDPIHNATPTPSSNASTPNVWTFSKQSWSINSNVTPAAFDHSLYHGLICSITWNPATTYLTSNVGPMDIAFGNTPTEALSALIATLSGNTFPGLETLLNALQLNMLGKISEPNGLFELDEALHQNSFGSTSGGTLWKITSIVTDSKNSQSNPQITLPDVLATDLNQLNILQDQYDNEIRQINSFRKQIFLDWYKYQLLSYAPSSPDPNINPNDVQALLSLEITNTLQNLINDTTPPSWYLEAAAKLGKKVFPNADVIKTLLIDKFPIPLMPSNPSLATQLTYQLITVLNELPATYQLQAGTAPRFWQTNDLSLLLSGNIVNPPLRYGGDNLLGNGFLPCRIDTQVFTALNLQANVVNGSSAISLNSSEMPTILGAPNIPYLATMNAIFAEVFFLDPGQAYVLGSKLLAQGGTTNPAVLDYGGLIGALKIFAASILSDDPSTNISVVGTLPAANVQEIWDGTPWLPLFLEWQVSYFPIQYISQGSGNYPTNFISTNFSLNSDNVDYIYSNPPPNTNAEVYTGSSFLTPDARFLLVDRLRTYIDNLPNPDPQWQQYINTLNNMPIMAQSLHGFNQFLLTRLQSMQLQVTDPNNHSPLGQQFSAQVANAVKNLNVIGPEDTYGYNPIRGGTLLLTQLRVVDVYGRVQEIYNAAVPPQNLVLARAQNLIPQNSPNNNLVYLAPRLTQGSRLSFRWLSAADNQIEMNSSPASTPICGWIMPNNINQSIMFYATNGTMIGSLILANAGQALIWQNAPGNNATIGKDFTNQTDRDFIFGNATELENFAWGLYQNGASFFQAFFTALEAKVININDQTQSQATAVLVGKPLALVRAALRLEVNGFPEDDQSWPAYEYVINNNNNYPSPSSPLTPPNRYLANFTSVQFPVLLGGLQTSDGLIGYFLQNNGQTNYQTFYAQAVGTAPDPTDPNVIIPSTNTLTLTCDSTATTSSLAVTMLVDPHAEIHATSGIHPVKAINIPSDQYAQALKQMAITLLTAPVLFGVDDPMSTSANVSNTNSVNIYAPQEIQVPWNWVQLLAGSWVNSSTNPDDGLAQMSYVTVQMVEGWLQCIPNPSTNPSTQTEES